MNPPAPQSRRTGWLFRGPWWQCALVVLAGVAVLVGVFYAEEDRRGQREWNQYRQAMEARGVSLDFQTYIPKPVPDEENFAAAKIVHDLFMDRNSAILTNDLYSFACNNIRPINSARYSGHRRFEDLVAWQMAAGALQHGPLNSKQKFTSDKTDLESRRQAAPVVLEGMKTDEAVFAAFRLVSVRPYSRFPLEYNLEDPGRIPFPHLFKIAQLLEHLELEIQAELAAGQTDKALADVKLMLYLTDSVKTEPFLISIEGRMSCIQEAVQAVWEGLAERQWTEPQLQELESCFQRYDFLADIEEPLKYERTFGFREIDVIRKKGLGCLEDFAEPPRLSFIGLLGRIMPAGWYDMEKLNYCAAFDAEMKSVLDSGEKRVFPDRVPPVDSGIQFDYIPPKLSMSCILHHQIFVTAIQPADFLMRIPRRVATSQTAANQAAIACALERFRLAIGQFPETLDALAPAFISRLPNDILNGQPYRYRRTADGQFVLYSVGCNEKDDGGAPGKTLFDGKKGDWVWDYPAK